MMIHKPMVDPVIAEIHRTRREVSKRFAGDVAAIAQDAARRQAVSGRTVWHPVRESVATEEVPDSRGSVG